MVVALSGRIFLDETVEATPESVLRQIWEDQFILAPAAAAPVEEPLLADSPVRRPRPSTRAGHTDGAAARRPKQLDAEPLLLEADGRGGAGAWS